MHTCTGCTPPPPLSKIYPQHSTIDHISHNDRIELAITDLESQAEPNFAVTTRKYNVKRIMLVRRFKSETVSQQEAISYTSKILTNAEEDVLVQYINDLSIRGLPPRTVFGPPRSAAQLRNRPGRPGHYVINI
jgi:hypothetical protein